MTNNDATLERNISDHFARMAKETLQLDIDRTQSVIISWQTQHSESIFITRFSPPKICQWYDVDVKLANRDRHNPDSIVAAT